MFKKKEIIMLPTDQRSEIGDFTIIKVDQNGHLACGIKKGEPYRLSETRQHLYVLSYEPIEMGDWFYEKKCNYIAQHSPYGTLTQNSAKIIASTDEMIGLEIQGEFVKDYVNLCNDQNAPQTVQVEYNDGVCHCDTMEKLSLCSHSGANGECHAPNPNNDFYGLKPKNYKGKVYIQILKENYTRKELIDIIRQYDSYLTEANSGFKQSALVDEWIENNI